MQSNNSKHVYVLTREYITYDKKEAGSYIWNAKLGKYCDWVGFGLSDLGQLQQNQYNFSPLTKRNGFNNGTFGVSSNGYTWNSNNEKENNTLVLNPARDLGTLYSFKYTPSTKLLEYVITSEAGKKQRGVLHDVCPTKGNALYPCIILIRVQSPVVLSPIKHTA